MVVGVVDDVIVGDHDVDEVSSGLVVFDPVRVVEYGVPAGCALLGSAHVDDVAWGHGVELRIVAGGGEHGSDFLVQFPYSVVVDVVGACSFPAAFVGEQVA